MLSKFHQYFFFSFEFVQYTESLFISNLLQNYGLLIIVKLVNSLYYSNLPINRVNYVLNCPWENFRIPWVFFVRKHVSLLLYSHLVSLQWYFFLWFSIDKEAEIIRNYYQEMQNPFVKHHTKKVVYLIVVQWYWKRIKYEI